MLQDVRRRTRVAPPGVAALELPQREWLSACGAGGKGAWRRACGTGPEDRGPTPARRLEVACTRRCPQWRFQEPPLLVAGRSGAVESPIDSTTKVRWSGRGNRNEIPRLTAFVSIRRNFQPDRRSRRQGRRARAPSLSAKNPLDLHGQPRIPKTCSATQRQLPRTGSRGARTLASRQRPRSGPGRPPPDLLAPSLLAGGGLPRRAPATGNAPPTGRSTQT